MDTVCMLKISVQHSPRTAGRPARRRQPLSHLPWLGALRPYSNTRSSDTPLGLMVLSHERWQRRRARQELLDEHEEQPCAKGRKADTIVYYRQFWYTLLTVTLTRRALAEFDRRAAATRHPIRGEVKPPAKNRILRSDTCPLRAFASRGVPDLSELRGVSGLEPFQCKTALMISAVF